MSARKRTIRRKLRIEPRFDEFDMMGSVHNAVYYKWFEQGRFQILCALMSFDELLALNAAVPVVRSSCEYKSFTRLGDTLILVTTHEINIPYPGKLSFSHTLVHEKKKKEIASGEVVVTLMDLGTKTLVREWPPDLWSRYINLR